MVGVPKLVRKEASAGATDSAGLPQTIRRSNGKNPGWQRRPPPAARYDNCPEGSRPIRSAQAAHRQSVPCYPLYGSSASKRRACDSSHRPARAEHSSGPGLVAHPLNNLVPRAPGSPQTRTPVPRGGRVLLLVTEDSMAPEIDPSTQSVSLVRRINLTLRLRPTFFATIWQKPGWPLASFVSEPGRDHTPQATSA